MRSGNEEKMRRDSLAIIIKVRGRDCEKACGQVVCVRVHVCVCMRETGSVESGVRHESSIS